MRRRISVVLLFVCINISGICRGEDRSQLTPREALLGHWGKKGEAVEHYYSPGKYIVVSKFGKRKVPYRIISAHGDNLRIKRKVSSWYTTTYKFSPDRNSIRIGSTEDWFVDYIYIDNKQRPDEE